MSHWHHHLSIHWPQMNQIRKQQLSCFLVFHLCEGFWLWWSSAKRISVLYWPVEENLHCKILWVAVLTVHWSSTNTVKLISALKLLSFVWTLITKFELFLCLCIWSRIHCSLHYNNHTLLAVLQQHQCKHKIRKRPAQRHKLNTERRQEHVL